MATTVITTYPEEGMIQVQWPSLVNGDSGDAAQPTKYPTKAVQATGTFGVGGSVAIEGSNDKVNWSPLRDSLGVAIALTAANIVRDILENPRHIRAHVTAGDGTTALAVTLIGV